jgi:GNAT superfamily N-acetyltransferase
MPSHYGSYIYEREGKSIYEDERGFITYIFWNDLGSVYLEDIYVAPEYRRSKATFDLVKKVEDEARAKGYKTLVGSVKPRANGATTSLKGMLAHGFEVDSCDGTLIWFKRHIKKNSEE